MKSKLLVSAVIFDKLIKPFNALINSLQIGFKITDLAPMYDRIYAFGLTLQATPELVCVDPYRLFDNEGLVAWDTFEMEKQQLSVGSSTKVDLTRQIRSKLYSRDEDWPQMEPHVLSHLKAYGCATRASLERNCKDMLSPDGEFCVGKQTPHMRQVASKCDTTDDANEQTFAVAKCYKRKFEPMGESNVMALACVRKNGHLGIGEKPAVYKQGKQRVVTPQPVRFPAPPPPCPAASLRRRLPAPSAPRLCSGASRRQARRATACAPCRGPRRRGGSVREGDARRA
jgi:hypothetical protein